MWKLTQIFCQKLKHFLSDIFHSNRRKKRKDDGRCWANKNPPGAEEICVIKYERIKHEKKSYDCELRGENCICFQMFVISSKRQKEDGKHLIKFKRTRRLKIHKSDDFRCFLCCHFLARKFRDVRRARRRCGCWKKQMLKCVLMCT